MQHKDFVKAAKELNKLAGTTLKVVAVKGDVLQKSIQDIVPTLTDFNFSTLSDATLDVLDELKCEMPEGEYETIEQSIEKIDEIEVTDEYNVDEETTLETDGPDSENLNEVFITDESLVAAAEDLIDVLGLPKEDIEKFEKLDFKAKVKELQKMADVINEPYKEDGKTINPNDKPEDFKPETIKVFEANGIKVKWNEEVKEEPVVKEEKQKRPDPIDRKNEKKDKPKAAPSKPKAKDKVSKAAKKKSMNRSVSIAQALEKGGTKKEIAENSNKIFIDNGGKDNLKMAEKRLGYILPALLHLNVIEKKDNKFSLVK